MYKMTTFAIAATAIIGAFAASTGTADAATQITSNTLRNYCDAEKARRGLAGAGINRIVISVNSYGQPNLRCLMSAYNRQSWLIAGADAVCGYATGNSGWFRQGNAIYCRAGGSSGNAGQPRLRQPLGLNNNRFRRFNRGRRPRCIRVGVRFVCR